MKGVEKMKLQERTNKVNTQKELDAVAAFLVRESEEIAAFLAGSEKYRTFSISLTKHADFEKKAGSLELEVSVYEDGKTHYYLEHGCNRKELINKINALAAQEEEKT